MQHSTDFGCSADLASGLPPDASPRPAGGSRCAPRMPYPHDPAGMPPPVCWCLPAADRLRRNAAGCAGGNPQIIRIAYTATQMSGKGIRVRHMTVGSVNIGCSLSGTPLCSTCCCRSAIRSSHIPAEWLQSVPDGSWCRSQQSADAQLRERRMVSSQAPVMSRHCRAHSSPRRNPVVIAKV